MTSEERREARYQRRRAARRARLEERNRSIGGVDRVFGYDALYMAGRRCCNGVRWKQSTQRFEAHLFSGTARQRRELLDGKWKPHKYVRFTIRERGKTGTIDAPHIKDRQVHKALTRGCLIPLFGPSMIYDNGASIKGKGLHFCFRRLKEQLRWHYQRYGRSGYVLLMDFSRFFPSAPHETLYQRHRRLILDEDLRRIADSIIDTAPGGEGMPLGVEPSQIEMVSLPSPIDNHIKCQRSVHCAAHYMDDYCAVLPDMERLVQLRGEVIAMAERMGLHINPAKCSVVSVTKWFKFCKAKILLEENGKVVMRGSRDSMKRAKRKLRSFRKKRAAGGISLEKVDEYMVCQRAYFDNYDDHGRVLILNRMRHAMFEEEVT